MLNKNVIKILQILILIVLISSFVCAERPGNFDDYLDEYIEGNNWYENTFGTFNYNAPQIGWYDVEDWEVELCSEVLSTEFFSGNTGAVNLEIDDRNYDLTIAMNPKVQETSFTDEEGEPEYAITLGWYIQGLTPSQEEDATVEYRIKMDGSDSIPLANGDFVEEFSVITGSTGFYTNYTSNQYTEAILKFDDNDAYTYNVVCVDLDDDVIECNDLYGE